MDSLWKNAIDKWTRVLAQVDDRNEGGIMKILEEERCGFCIEATIVSRLPVCAFCECPYELCNEENTGLYREFYEVLHEEKIDWGYLKSLVKKGIRKLKATQP